MIVGAVIANRQLNKKNPYDKQKSNMCRGEYADQKTG